VSGLSVARAVESLGLRPTLKWPNDVLLDGRKVVGVLTEMEAELERVHVVIAGIGVNVNVTREEFPPYLRDKATSLAIAAGRRTDRAGFAAAMLAELETDYRRFLDGGFRGLRADYERRSVLAGRQVTVATRDGERTGDVEGIDDDGALRLVDAAGHRHHVV